MSRSTRVLLAGAYAVVLVYVAWPLVVPAEREGVNIVRQIGAVAFSLVCVWTFVMMRPRPLLYVVAGLNALLTAVFSVLFVTQAVTVGFDSLTRNNLPAEIFFLAFVPAVAGVTLHSTLKRGSVA
jgi:hypothetical protein